MESDILFTEHHENPHKNKPFSDQVTVVPFKISNLNTDVSSPSATPTSSLILKVNFTNQTSKTATANVEPDSRSKTGFVLQPAGLEKKRPLFRQGNLIAQTQKSKPIKTGNSPNQSSNISIFINTTREYSESVQERHADRLAKSTLTYYFIGIYFNIIINTIGLLSELNIAHYSWILFLFQGLFLGVLVKKIVKSKFTSLDFTRKMAKIVEIMDLICYFTYFTFVLLRIYDLYDSLHLATLPSWSVTLLIFTTYFKWLCSFPSADIYWSLVNVVSWSQLLLVSLKVEKIKISWFCALSIWLFIASLFGAIALLCFIIWIIRNIRSFCHFSGSTNTKIVTNLWYRFSSLLSIIFAVLVFSVSRQLDSNEIIPLKMVFIIGVVYSILLLIFTRVFKRTILKEISEIVSSLKGVKVIENGQEIFELEEPALKFLKKISSTYFSPEAVSEAFKKTDKEEFQKTVLNAIRIKSIFLKNALPYGVNRVSRTLKCCELGNKDIRTQTNSSFVVSAYKQDENALSNKFAISNNEIKNKEFKGRSYSYDDIENYNTSLKFDQEINKPEEDKCFLCLDKEPNAVIMECGHGGMCYRCAIKIWKKRNQCHMCRRQISNILRIKQLFDSANFKVKNKIIKRKPPKGKSWLKILFI